MCHAQTTMASNAWSVQGVRHGVSSRYTGLRPPSPSVVGAAVIDESVALAGVDFLTGHMFCTHHDFWHLLNGLPRD